MSVRTLSSLLIRRFSPRRNPGAQAAQAETGSESVRPARSLHTLSDTGAAVGAVGALSAAGLAALFGFVYLKFKKVDEESSYATVAGKVTHNGARTVELTGMRAAVNDPSITAMFTDKDGNISWMEYYDYLVFRKHYLDRFREHYLDSKKPVTDKEARTEVPDSWNVPVKQVGNVMKVDEARMKKKYEEFTKKHDEAYKNRRKMIMEQEYKVDEAMMKKRFEDWMKEFGRTYKNEKEKARQYEVFKLNAIKTDKLNAHSHGGARYRPKKYGDWTEDERERLGRHQGDVDFKSLVEELRASYAEGGSDAHQRKIAGQELECTDAVKKRFRELRERKAEQERQAKKH